MQHVDTNIAPFIRTTPDDWGSHFKASSRLFQALPAFRTWLSACTTGWIYQPGLEEPPHTRRANNGLLCASSGLAPQDDPALINSRQHASLHLAPASAALTCFSVPSETASSCSSAAAAEPWFGAGGGAGFGCFLIRWGECPR